MIEEIMIDMQDYDGSIELEDNPEIVKEPLEGFDPQQTLLDSPFWKWLSRIEVQTLSEIVANTKATEKHRVL